MSEPRKLTRAQCEALGDKLGPMLGYLHRVVERMPAIGMDLRDKALVELTEAAHRLQAATVHLHYRSVRGPGASNDLADQRQVAR